MKPFRSLSAVEQLATYLRGEIQGGGLDGEMPGVAQLVRRLGVGTKTVVAAVEILKKDGTLEANGERRRSRIVQTKIIKKTGLRIHILMYERNDVHDERVVALRLQLEERGHQVAYAPKTLKELHFDVNRVARMVEKNGCDAWVILAGSQPVLEWFTAQPVPAFAVFGRPFGIQIASLTYLKSPALTMALHRLVEFGHRRIVMLVREERRKPTPGVTEQRFLDVLTQLGISVGAYNLPDWEDNPKSFYECLNALFRHTPPTALFSGEPALFFATQQFLAGKGLTVPGDVSLLTLDENPLFDWLHPEVSHIRTDSRRFVPRVLQWVENVANNRADLQQTLIESKFIEGGTIGPCAG